MCFYINAEKHSVLCTLSSSKMPAPYDLTIVERQNDYKATNYKTDFHQIRLGDISGMFLNHQEAALPRKHTHGFSHCLQDMSLHSMHYHFN